MNDQLEHLSGLKRLLSACVFVLIFISVNISASLSIAATNSGITYQGRILKPDSTPLTGATVQFKMQIRSPDANNCLMYEEQQVLDMRNSNGVFAITMNDGSGTRTDATGLNLDRVLSNAAGPANVFSFNPATCSAGSNYTAGSSDGRNLVVMFKDETMSTFEPMPAQKINFAPFAFEAKQIAGFTPASLVRVAESDGTLDTVSPLSNANYTELLALIAGTSAQYTKKSATAGSVVSTTAGNVATPSAGSVWLDTTAGNLKFYDGTVVKTLGTAGGSVTSVATGAGLTGGPITTTGTIALATVGAGGTGYKVTYDTYGRVTAAVALVEADIPTLSAAGKVIGSAITSGTIGGSTAINTTGTISSSAITSSGLITSPSLSATAIGTQSVQVFETTNSFKVTIQAPASLGANYALTLPTNAGTPNQVLTTNGAGLLSWSTPAGTGFMNGGNTFGANSSIGNNDNVDLTVKTSSLPRITVQAGGNVGIGTTTPVDKLQVAGGGVVLDNATYYKQKDDGGTVRSILGTLADGSVVLNGYHQNPVINAVNGATYLSGGSGNDITISSSGKVGIGTTAPASMLDINGNLNISGTGRRITADFSSNASWANDTFFQSNVANKGSFLRVLPNGTSPYAGFGTFGSSDPANTSVGTFSMNDVKSNELAIELFATGSGVAPDMALYETNFLPLVTFKQGGNVGIGTTAPLTSLHVYAKNQSWSDLAAGLTTDYYVGSGASIGAALLMRSANGTALAPTATKSGDAIGQTSFSGYDGTSFQSLTDTTGIVTYASENWTPTSHGTKMQFYTIANGTAATINASITILDKGNVGIGTATPSYALDTVGQIKTRFSGADATGIIIGNNGAQQPQVQFTASDNSARFKLLLNSLNAPTERLSFYAGPLNSIATTEAMVIGGNGNVGIGTTAPSGKLEVNSGAAGAATGININTTSVAANTYQQYMANGTVIGSITSAAGANVAFNTTSDVRLKGGFQPVLSPLKTLNQIEVSNFYYLLDPAHRQDGFKAQQLYQVLRMR